MWQSRLGNRKMWFIYKNFYCLWHFTHALQHQFNPGLQTRPARLPETQDHKYFSFLFVFVFIIASACASLYRTNEINKCASHGKKWKNDQNYHELPNLYEALFYEKSPNERWAPQQKKSSHWQQFWELTLKKRNQGLEQRKGIEEIINNDKLYRRRNETACYFFFTWPISLAGQRGTRPA